MLVFNSVNKNVPISFEENDDVQLCSRCSTPNNMQLGYCIDCDGPLQTPRTRYLKAKDVIRCPACGHYSSREDLICSNHTCLAQLAKSDCLEVTNKEGETQKCVDAPVVKYMKRCPECKHVNQPNNSACAVCGASLDLVDEEPVSEQAAFIVNIATHIREIIKKDVWYIIGTRNFLAEQLRSLVSGKHVKVTWDGAHFHIMDVSETGTYINGQRIEQGKDVVVPLDAVIELGNASPSQPMAARFRFDSQHEASIVNVGTQEHTKLEENVPYMLGSDIQCFLSNQLRTFVSGEHVKVAWDGEQFHIVDVSSNGTYIKGRRIRPGIDVTVSSGTVIGLGDVSISTPMSAHFRLESNAD